MNRPKGSTSVNADTHRGRRISSEMRRRGSAGARRDGIITVKVREYSHEVKTRSVEFDYSRALGTRTESSAHVNRTIMGMMQTKVNRITIC